MTELLTAREEMMRAICCGPADRMDAVRLIAKEALEGR